MNAWFSPLRLSNCKNSANYRKDSLIKNHGASSRNRQADFAKVAIATTAESTIFNFFSARPGQGSMRDPKTSKNFRIHSGWAGQAGAVTR